MHNIRTSNSIHLYAFNKTIEFIEKFVDKRIAMVLRLVYNSTSANFEAMGDLLGDLIISGNSFVIRESFLRQNTVRLHSELEEVTKLHERTRSSFQSSIKSSSNLFKAFGEESDDYEPKIERRLSQSPSGMEIDISLGDNGLSRDEQNQIEKPRRMTFLQLNDLISELSSTKLEVDIKNIETRMPKRTMEAHLHEIFKTKFGLRNMIMENLTSFLFTLKYYSAFDTRAKAFLAIVRNECEEEFLQVIETIERSLLSLLKVHLM